MEGKLAKHYGKAMVQADHGKITFVTECSICGRMQFGPIDAMHLRSMATMLVKMADHLNIPEDNFAQEMVREVNINSHEELKRTVADWEATPMVSMSEHRKAGRLPSSKSVWDEERVH